MMHLLLIVTVLAQICVCEALRMQPQMNIFSSLFGKKKEASASHILIKSENGPTFLTNLKNDLSKSKNLPDAFAEAAAKYSACPSAKKGGSLGTFKQGAMVPAFDKVIFTEEVGKVHGPIKTPFGAHLILIESRED
jgi:peptidyl-prolyl cis-trans isomerase C